MVQIYIKKNGKAKEKGKKGVKNAQSALICATKCAFLTKIFAGMNKNLFLCSRILEFSNIINILKSKNYVRN